MPPPFVRLRCRHGCDAATLGCNAAPAGCNAETIRLRRHPLLAPAPGIGCGMDAGRKMGT